MDFTLENRLTCLNTKFLKRNVCLLLKRLTYIMNIRYEPTLTQITLNHMNKKWINNAYSSFEGVSFDNRIVIATIRLSLRRNGVRTTTAHYDWSLLKNKDISDKHKH